MTEVRKKALLGLLVLLWAETSYAAASTSIPGAASAVTASQQNSATPGVTVAGVGETPQLQKCLKRADDLPDIAAAEAYAWIKKGGGAEAQLCRAFAQANRGMHIDAAREFWSLAASYDKTNASRAVLMHDLSGQEFLRAKDPKNAETQFATALMIGPESVDSLVGRAEALMAVERYWEALDDLNRALKINSKDIEAHRQRGFAWVQLGNEKNAEEDFEQAELLSVEPEIQK